MTDKFSKAKRREIMQNIQSRSTRPEQTVYSILKSLRFRPNLNFTELPGTPDFVLKRRKIVIFVHGCFWHRHHCKRGNSKPNTNADFWARKFDLNRKRDKRTQRSLQKLGWKSLILWECRIKKLTAESLRAQIKALTEANAKPKN